MHKSIVTPKDSKPEDQLLTTADIPCPEARREFIEDLAIAEQMLEDYEAHGIERTTPYSEYRARRLGSNTSKRA